MPWRRRLTRVFATRGRPSTVRENGRITEPRDVLVRDVDRLEEIRDPVPAAAPTHGIDLRQLGVLKSCVRALRDRDDLDEALPKAAREVTTGSGRMEHGELPPARLATPPPAMEKEEEMTVVENKNKEALRWAPVAILLVLALVAPAFGDSAIAVVVPLLIALVLACLNVMQRRRT
ncbi:hypothetical protein [Streptomyces lavendulocolor]|uniref:hypothetical protein n=1 Tax=Streptomyces lavendulocolor TaxID=67316 RepID=UPI0031D04EB3